VHLLGVPELATTLALRNRSPFLLDFIQRSLGMSARRRAVALDAGLAECATMMVINQERMQLPGTLTKRISGC
jgi:hypothetical protein